MKKTDSPGGLTATSERNSEQPDERPVAFMSYAWSSEPHRAWVQQLADDLVHHNVDVIFDGYHLKPGHDTYAYMEQMVTKPDVRKVLCVCDRLYQEKADGREGGVGAETQIITPELYEKTDQVKFVPLVREVDEEGKPYLPTFLKGRYFIDFSDDDQYDARLDELLRDIYGKPKRPKPPFGPPPAFLDEDAVQLATAGMARRIERCLIDNPRNTRRLLERYTDTFVDAMSEYQITPEQFHAPDMDDHVWESVHELRAYRDDFLKIVDAVALHGGDNDDTIFNAIRRFFERSFEFGSLDHFRYLRRDMFMSAIGVLLRRECFSGASRLLSDGYYVTRHSEKRMASFTAFDEHMPSLDEVRIRRLKLNRQSLVADLIKDLVPAEHYDFDFARQVDYLLFVRAVVDAGDPRRHGYVDNWYPRTAPYLRDYSRFELFERAESHRGLQNLLTVLGVESKQEFLDRFEAGGRGEGDWFHRDWPRAVVRAAERWPG